jgi:hypothetical protein
MEYIVLVFWASQQVKGLEALDLVGIINWRGLSGSTYGANI